MRHPLVPGGSSGELTCHSFTKATTFADLLLEEGYVVMISREEDLYIVNYIWSERDADRNDVVFMDRCDFDMEFCEVEDDEEDDDYYKQQRLKRDAENSAWFIVRQLIHKSPEQLEEIFGITTDEEREKFWKYYPDQLMYEEARDRLTEWERKRMADTEEAVMQEAVKWWDIMDEEQLREKMDDQST